MAENKTSYFKLTAEAKVGLFVLMGIAMLVYMSLRLGGITLGRHEGYTLTVSFATAAGVDKDAPVRVAGVEVGRVKEIKLIDSRARLVLEIKPDIKIGKDFTAVLTTKGLLGEKYLELLPGSPNAPPLKDGDEITRTITYTDMDKLITVLSDVATDIKGVTDSLNRVLGGAEGENTLRNIVKNIEEITFRLNKVVENNDERFTEVLKNLNEFTALLRNEGPGVASDIKLAVKNLNDAIVKTSGNFNSMIDENRGSLKEGVDNLRLASLKLQEAMDTLNKVTKEVGPGLKETATSIGSIAKKIDSGEGTLGRLVNDKTLHENINKTISGINSYIEKAESFHTFIGYRGEYLFDPRDTKSYLSIKIQPKADKYYLLEIIDDPRGKRRKEVRDTTTGSTTTTTTDIITTDQLKFSAQIAKRFGDLVVRGGLIESTGGAGLDYYLLKEKVRLSFEAFDFNKGDNPHLKAYATVNFAKFFFLSGGYDDFMSKKGLKSPYVGLGFQFNDEDIKYIMSSAPPVKF